MSIVSTIDSRRFNDNLNALQEALLGSGQMGDAATVIQDAARLLIKQALKFTPPVKQSAGSDRKQGEAAVARDIRRAMRVPMADEWKNERVKKLIEANDREGFQAFIKNVPKLKSWKVEAFSPSLHRRARKSRGRVQGSQRVFVMEAAKVAQYISTVQRRVGYMRSGWLLSAQVAALSVKTPWIKRHSSTKGVGISQLANRLTPSITIGNRTPGIGTIRHAFQSAVNVRFQAMRRRIKLILSGYSKDLAANMRPRKSATLTNASA